MSTDDPNPETQFVIDCLADEPSMDRLVAALRAKDPHMGLKKLALEHIDTMEDWEQVDFEVVRRELEDLVRGAIDN